MSLAISSLNSFAIASGMMYRVRNHQKIKKIGSEQGIFKINYVQNNNNGTP